MPKLSKKKVVLTGVALLGIGGIAWRGKRQRSDGDADSTSSTNRGRG
jgi:hypothetical protein